MTLLFPTRRTAVLCAARIRKRRGVVNVDLPRVVPCPLRFYTQASTRHFVRTSENRCTTSLQARFRPRAFGSRRPSQGTRGGSRPCKERGLGAAETPQYFVLTNHPSTICCVRRFRWRPPPDEKGSRCGDASCDAKPSPALPRSGNWKRPPSHSTGMRPVPGSDGQ